MAFDTWGYISNLISQSNINNMDDATRARLADLIKKGVATKTQQSWEPGKDPKPASDFTDTGAAPTADEWEELYRVLQDTFDAIKQDKDLLTDSKVANFIAKYYGAGKAIEPVEYTDIFSSDEQRKQIAEYIAKRNVSLVENSEIPQKDLDKLRTSLEGDGKYYEKPKLVQTLTKVIGHIYNDTNTAVLPAFLLTSPLSEQEAADIGKYIQDNEHDLAVKTGLTINALQELRDGLNNYTFHKDNTQVENLRILMSHMDFSGPTPAPGIPPNCLLTGGAYDIRKARKLLDKITSFQRNGGADTKGDVIEQLYQDVTKKKPISYTQARELAANAPDIFQSIYKTKEVSDAIKSKDSSGDLRRSIAKGLDDSNYKDGKNILTPKYDDRKRFFKRAKEKIQNKYGDTLGKLSQKHKRHIYSTDARYIVEQLIKKNIDPTSGTEKLMGALDSIKGNLPSPVQTKMKWISETFQKLSGQDFFKDALRDGKQMRRLVQEIIKAAAHDGKKEEAKTALEMLSVMRYTMTTSSIRDKLKGTDFTIFGDSSMSYNKDGGELVQAFSKGVDKLLKTMTMAAFEIGNLAKNAINTHGVKFKKGQGHLGKTITDSVEYKDADKKAMMEELFAFWDFVNSSGQSKDYNIFRSHKKKQGKADTHTGATYTVTAGTNTLTIDDPTEQEKKFLDFYKSHKIGRNA